MRQVGNWPRRRVRRDNPAMDSIVIATRESRLALWQAEHVQALLAERLSLPATLLGMTTRGDQILDRSLSKVGGKGLFVKELEVAMSEGRADLAVHSLKDVPMDLPEGFSLVAVLEREDPTDAFVSPHYADLGALPLGACVGTSSLRRVAQLLALRPDLRIEPLRGNLDTRLRKLDEGLYDAIVLASAGLMRLGLAGRIRDRFGLDEMIPCAGQGALGLEIRSNDQALAERLAPLRNDAAWLAVHAERAVSRVLGGSCSVPLAAHAVWARPGHLALNAALGDHTGAGRPLLRCNETAAVADTAAAESLGQRVAAGLLAAGGASYLQAVAVE